MKRFQQFLATALVLLPALVLSGPTHAQTYQAQTYNVSATTARIEGFNVEEVRRLTPGTELNFDIYGTPGGIATLYIAGATRALTLVEAEAGQYEGTYTINERDRIEARSAVTANLRVGNQVASMVLNESLLAGVGPHRTSDMQAPGVTPRIERFRVEPIANLNGGDQLQFTVFGTPGGKMDLAVNGVKGKLFLNEVNNGEYTGTYTIKRRDRITQNSVVTANLRVGERLTSATLENAIQLASSTAPLALANACPTCGTIEAINRVEVKGDGGYLGALGGGVVGALLGSQVGSGKGKTAAQIAGAVGGAYAGYVIEGKVRKAYHYEVLVRMQNGTSQTVSYATDPDFRVGDAVKINDGVLVRNL